MGKKEWCLLLVMVSAASQNLFADEVVSQSCMSKGEHANRANLEVPGERLWKVWPTSEIVSRMPSIGGTEEVEVYIMKTFVSVMSETVIPGWIVDVPYYALGLRPLDDISWHHAQSATLIHYAPANTSALLGLPGLDAASSLAQIYTSSRVGTNEWETASFVARITGEEVQRLAEGISDYLEKHPYYQAIAAKASADDSFISTSSASADFAIWALNKLSSDGVTVAPLIPPKFIHMTYYISSPREISNQDEAMTTASEYISFFQTCLGRPHQNATYLLVDELAALVSTCLTKNTEIPVTAIWPMTISSQEFKHTSYSWSLKAATVHTFSVAATIATPSRPKSSSSRSKGNAIDWILTLLLIAFLIAGGRAFMVKTGCARQFAYTYFGTPLVQTSHEREARASAFRSNSRSSDLYQRLQHSRDNINNNNIQLNNFSFGSPPPSTTHASSSSKQRQQHPKHPSSSENAFDAFSTQQQTSTQSGSSPSSFSRSNTNGPAATVETTAGFV